MSNKKGPLSDGWLRRQCRLSIDLLDSLPPGVRASLYFPNPAPAPTAPTRPCATWPHLECACRGGLSGGASTCTRRREAERAAPTPTASQPATKEKL